MVRKVNMNRGQDTVEAALVDRTQLVEQTLS